MGKERNYHFDNIKALLILLVVMGHICSKFDGGAAAGVTYKIIFSFHIPCFIFVSGYFAKYNPKKTIGRLLPLYVVFQLVEYVETGIISLIKSGVWRPSEAHIFFKSNFAMWYLLALMIYGLLIPLFDTKDAKKRIFVIAVAFALGMGIGFAETGGVLSLSRVFVFLPYFIIGYYEKDARILTSAKKNHPLLCKITAIVIFTATAVIIALFSKEINHRIFLAKDVFGDTNTPWQRLITWGLGLCGIYWIYMLVPERKLPLVSDVGKNTLSVYLIHAPLILALIETPVYDIVRASYFGMWAFAVALTLVLSRVKLSPKLSLIAFTKKSC